MFSIDMFKSYKFKTKNKQFEVLINKAFSWKSKFEWLYYYIDKSSLVFSEDRKECDFKIEFFKKEQLISEIHFFMKADREIWESFSDKQLEFIIEVVKDIFTYSEKLWIYIIPEEIIPSYYNNGFYSRYHKFKNFKLFDENFKILYEVKDIRVETDSYGNIKAFKSNNNWGKALITKEW